MPRSIGCLRSISRAVVRTSLIAAFVLGLPNAAVSHEGEDHGETPSIAATAAGVPTAETHSETYEAVVQRDGDNLVLFLDDFASNEPIVAARVAITVGDTEVDARETSPGTYTATPRTPLPPGAVSLGLVIQGVRGDDLLSLDLAAVPVDEAEHGHFDWLAFAVGVGAVLGLTLLLFFGRRMLRRRIAAALAIAAILLAAPDRPAFAHEGEDHGEAPPAAVAGGNRAVRLPDGSIFLPKPSQRVLGVRTVRAGAASGPATVRLPGQAVTDPSGFARVATARGGRLLPAGTRFPRLGERIAAGQPLFRVEPALSAVEAASNASELRALDREVRLADQEARRLGQLEGIVARAEIERARANLAGLRAQRSALAQPVSTAEVVRAPIAGSVASVAGAIGEVATPGTVVVEIIGTNGLLIEARGTPSSQGRGITSAVGITRDGRRLALALVGRSPQLAQGAERLQFRVDTGAMALRAGEPVTVEAVLTGAAVQSGLALPAEAVVRSTSGEATVWTKPSAMVFVPRIVRMQPLPGGRVLVLAGLEPGQRVVTQGAALLAQVR